MSSIFEKHGISFVWDSQSCKLELTKNNKVVGKCQCAFDFPNHFNMISNVQVDEPNLVLILCQGVNEYLENKAGKNKKCFYLLSTNQVEQVKDYLLPEPEYHVNRTMIVPSNFQSTKLDVPSSLQVVFDKQQILSDDYFTKVLHLFRSSAYWLETISEEAAKARISVALINVAIFDGDKLVAFARIVSNQGDLAYVSDVVVDKNEQGKGLGSLVMSELLNHPSSKAHKYSILLRAYQGTTVAAEKLYKKFGFVYVPELRSTWNDEYLIVNYHKE